MFKEVNMKAQDILMHEIARIKYTSEEELDEFKQGYITGIERAIKEYAKELKIAKPEYKLELYPKHMLEGIHAPYCPKCFHILLDDSNDCFEYCPECGVKIDWE